MARILHFMSRAGDWQAYLAEPKKHWRTGYFVVNKMLWPSHAFNRTRWQGVSTWWSSVPARRLTRSR